MEERQTKKMPSVEKRVGQSGNDGFTIGGFIDEHEIPKLARNFNWVSMLATCVSLMATWEAFCSTMASGLVSGGPVSLVYGYILALVGTLTTAFSLSEAASMYPNAGGQYYFVFRLAPPKFRLGLSWTAGWITTFGWQSIAASAPFLAGTMIQGLVVLNYPNYVYERWHGTLIYWAVLLLALIFNTLASRILPMVENITMALHIVLFFVILITMIVASPSKHSASFVFTHFQNFSGWESDGVAWCIGMLSASYVLVGYDGATHMSEEMTDPAVGVPRAMIGSLLINGVIGFAFLVALLFCMGDVESALGTSTGYPIIQIFYNITGGNTRAASAMTASVIILAIGSTIPLVSSATRTLWALARDDAIPFSEILAKVDAKRQIPTMSIVVTTIFLAILGLLNIASSSAFSAILSLAVVALYISYLMPVVAILYLRLFKPEQLFYGPFKLGKFGVATNIFSIVYTICTCIFLLFPPYRPVTPTNMNYAPVVLAGVLLFSAVFWVYKGRKTYRGPVVIEELMGRSVTRSSEAYTT